MLPKRLERLGFDRKVGGFVYVLTSQLGMRYRFTFLSQIGPCLYEFNYNILDVFVDLLSPASLRTLPQLYWDL